MSAAVLTIVALASCWTALAVEVSNRYRSPRNPERAVRSSTELIVLHTTEAPARSSLTKLCDRGEAHYCVTEDGTIYAIVDRDREAFHAGRSMWNGKEDVDKFSVGIECVGYHDKRMGIVQLRAIAALVKELKAMYRLGDDRVVCHSHVAYGAPNRWQRHRHRGRKRCGMLFATNTIRQILGLTAKPKSDPDTRAGRLVVGDPYLRQVLYGGVDTMVCKDAACKNAAGEATGSEDAAEAAAREAAAGAEDAAGRAGEEGAAHRGGAEVHGLFAQGRHFAGTDRDEDRRGEVERRQHLLRDAGQGNSRLDDQPG